MSDKYELQSKSIVDNLFQLLDESGKVLSLDELGQIPAVNPAEDLIPLKDWAEQNGLSPATARQKAGRGALKTARKVGRDWMISRYERNVDHRYKDSVPRLDGPIRIDQVLNYLLLLDPTSLPDRFDANSAHRKYCKRVFLGLRGSLNGNEQVLFDLLCDVMANQPQTEVYFLPHDEILSNIRDEAFDELDVDMVDFADYLLVLVSTAKDLLGHVIELDVPGSSQTVMMPWYKSLSWKKEKDDGVYFAPSSFFRIIFAGLR